MAEEPLGLVIAHRFDREGRPATLRLQRPTCVVPLLPRGRIILGKGRHGVHDSSTLVREAQVQIEASPDGKSAHVVQGECWVRRYGSTELEPANDAPMGPGDMLFLAPSGLFPYAIWQRGGGGGGVGTNHAFLTAYTFVNARNDGESARAAPENTRPKPQKRRERAPRNKLPQPQKLKRRRTRQPCAAPVLPPSRTDLINTLRSVVAVDSICELVAGYCLLLSGVSIYVSPKRMSATRSQRLRHLAQNQGAVILTNARQLLLEPREATPRCVVLSQRGTLRELSADLRSDSSVHVDKIDSWLERSLERGVNWWAGVSFNKPEWLSDSLRMSKRCHSATHTLAATIDTPGAAPAPRRAPAQHNDDNGTAAPRHTSRDDEPLSASLSTCPINLKVARALEELGNEYSVNGLTVKDRKYRALVNQRAAAVLRAHPTPIRTREQAMALQGIGPKTAEKIMEIIDTGGLGRIDAMRSQPMAKALNTLVKIHGIGRGLAEQLYRDGCGTIEQARESKRISEASRICIDLREELCQNIPRIEAEQYAAKVREILTSTVCRSLRVEIAGSYCRGVKELGDIDLLIHDDAQEDDGSGPLILPQILTRLKACGLVTHTLSTSNQGGHRGGSAPVFRNPRRSECCCVIGRLDSASPHRRIDIRVYHKSEIAFARLHFSSGRDFNRALRAHANNMGLSLSEHGLCRINVLPSEHAKALGRKIVQQGSPIHCRSEQEIFDKLGVPYYPPERRVGVPQRLKFTKSRKSSRGGKVEAEYK